MAENCADLEGNDVSKATLWRMCTSLRTSGKIGALSSRSSRRVTWSTDWTNLEQAEHLAMTSVRINLCVDDWISFGLLACALPSVKLRFWCQVVRFLAWPPQLNNPSAQKNDCYRSEGNSRIPIDPVRLFLIGDSKNLFKISALFIPMTSAKVRENISSRSFTL